MSTKNILNDVAKSTDVTDAIKRDTTTNDLDSIHIVDSRFTKIVQAGHTTTLNATISDLNDSGNVNWIMPDTATTLSVISTSAEDGVAGDGIQILIIQGLDQDYNEITDTIVMNGLTEVISSLSFRAVNISIALVGGISGSGAVGVITMSGSGGGGQVFGRYLIGDSTAEVGRYTVPKGMKYLGTSLVTSGGKNVDATYKLEVIIPGFLPVSSGELYVSQGINYFPNTTSQFLTEGQSFKMRGKYNSGGSGVRYMSSVVSGILGKTQDWESLKL